MKEHEMPMFTGVPDTEDVVDVDEYSRTTRACHTQLQEIWQDLELCDAAREQQLKDITDRALGVWSGAVEHAENHRKGIRRRIDDAAAEMRSIAELLGELAAIEDPNSSMASLLISPGKTLKRQFDEVMGELEQWRRKKATRMAEYDDLQAQINKICELLGKPVGPKRKAKNSITKGNMEFLKLELERMRGEKVKRERRLEGGLAKLRKLCIEVGADDTEVAASIHPSLRNFHEVMRGQYYTLSKPNVDAGDSKGEPVALTESVFTSLDARLEEIAADKTEREAALGEIREVLISMWTSVGISEDDENRKFFARLLTSSARLHSSTHEKCKEEISRLESEMAKTMRIIIQRNVDTVRELSKATGLPMPDLGAVLEGTDSEGLVAESLHKINLTVAQLKSVVAQREPIIKQIREVEEDFKEAHWHFVHSQDNLLNNRGRDANRMLQRIIKAEEKKKRLPKQIAKLHQMLDEWASPTSHGKPFVIGTVVYKAEVLVAIESELHAMSEFKARKKRPGTAGGKPPQGAATVQPLPPSKALKMIEAAHDIAQPIQSIQSLNSTLSEMGSGIGSGIVSKPVPAVAAEQESGAGDMSAELTVQETPALEPQASGAHTNPLQDLVNVVANTTASARGPNKGAQRYAAPLQSLQVDDSVELCCGSPLPADAAPTVSQTPANVPPSPAEACAQ